MNNLTSEAMAAMDDCDPIRSSLIDKSEAMEVDNPGGTNNAEKVEKSMGPQRTKKKRRPRRTLQKNPNAPRRFKSAYILFSTQKHREIRESLQKDRASKTKSTVIAKLVSQAWKDMPGNERREWEERARLDRERYEAEKANYTGTWRVPVKKPRRDPTAPKRPLTAFFLFSNSNRKMMTQLHPNATNAEISKALSQQWKASSPDVRQPYIEQERQQRQRYERAKAEWEAQKTVASGEESSSSSQNSDETALSWASSLRIEGDSDWSAMSRSATPEGENGENGQNDSQSSTSPIFHDVLQTFKNESNLSAPTLNSSTTASAVLPTQELAAPLNEGDRQLFGYIMELDFEESYTKGVER